MGLLEELGIPKIKDSTIKIDVIDRKKFEEEIDKEIEEIREEHGKSKDNK